MSTLVFTIFTDSVHHFGINHLPILSLSFGRQKRDDYHRSDRYKISYWTSLLSTGRGGETIYLAAFPNQLLRVCLSHFGLCVLPSETIPYRHSSVWPSCSCSWPHCRGQVLYIVDHNGGSGVGFLCAAECRLWTGELIVPAEASSLTIHTSVFLKNLPIQISSEVSQSPNLENLPIKRCFRWPAMLSLDDLLWPTRT